MENDLENLKARINVTLQEFSDLVDSGEFGKAVAVAKKLEALCQEGIEIQDTIKRAENKLARFLAENQ